MRIVGKWHPCDDGVVRPVLDIDVIGSIGISIWDRDVLDHFDVILSRRRDELFLLAPPSHYDIRP